jgi:uncharacterized protein YllA (UPF0747 family)
LRFEELPGIPKIWRDFLNSALSVLPAPSAMHTLAGRAELVRRRLIARDDLDGIFIGSRNQRSAKASENIRRLRQPDSVVVTANLYPSLFGGPATQILKCLTTIKVCDELSKHAIAAVPVGWIGTALPAGFSPSFIHLPDGGSELHQLQLAPPDTNGIHSDEPLPASRISALLNQIDEFGQGAFDPEAIEILKDSFQSGATLAHATGHLLALLMEEWGLIVVDSSSSEFQTRLPDVSSTEPPLESLEKTYLSQSAILPVLSCVIDCDEVDAYVRAQPFFDRIDQVQPLAWPRTSATLIDIRSRRTLERYHLDLHQLYSGEQAIMQNIRESLPGTASEKLKSLRTEADAQIAGLKALNASSKEFGKTLDSGHEKILFQINKLIENFDAARNRKLETAERQIHKACNLLAPDGGLQERELAGVHLPLRYSRSVLRFLYEKLDILNSEHQVILMD